MAGPHGVESETFASALRLQRAGDAARAAKLYEKLLRRNAGHAQALLLLGVLRLETGDLEAAEALFKRRLVDDPGDGLALHNLARLYQKRGDDSRAIELYRRATASKPFAPSFNDLGFSLHRIGELEPAIAAFDRAIAIDRNYATAHSNRGLVLCDLGRHREAIADFRRVLELNPDSAEAWCHLATACHRAGDLAEAEAAARRALALDAGYLDAYLQLAQTLERLHRPDEAEVAGLEWARRQRVVTKPCIGGRPRARVLILAGSRACNLPTQELLSNRRYETTRAHLLPPGFELLGEVPGCDILFNAIADADHGADFLPEAAAICDTSGLPVLNHPRGIARTRRDRAPGLLAGISGLTVPEVRKVNREELPLLTQLPEWQGTLLVRPTGAHGGDDLVRIDAPEKLGEYLRVVPQREFFVTRYYEYRNSDGRYRKYRFIFVDREVFPYHLAIADDWLVHYFRADMIRHAALREEEEAFLGDYRSAFPGPLAATIGEIAHRLNLDYAGLDCSIGPDGRVLLFEANASMLVHMGDRQREFSYKQRYVQRIFDAMGEMIAHRLALGHQRN
ncbi:MAG TPA: tetratricopeptide repeat protein [Stellaceae bacterium]|nr:tetratricopeptide repeat protein [Stellaceae bacterium]